MPGKTTPTLSGPTGAVHDDMDVIAVGASWVVNGAGFSPGQKVRLERAEAGVFVGTLDLVADAAGKFGYTGSDAKWGAYRYQAFTQRPNKSWASAAMTWFGAY